MSMVMGEEHKKFFYFFKICRAQRFEGVELTKEEAAVVANLMSNFDKMRTAWMDSVVDNDLSHI